MSKIKLTAYLMALLLLSSCSGGVVIEHDYCTYDSPIWVSHQDHFTDGTGRQLLKHNDQWQSICQQNADRA